MEVLENGTLRLVKMGPLGPFETNSYLIQDRVSGDAILVDAPTDGERILKALEGGRVARIVMTHRCPDHWESIDQLVAATGASVCCHEAEEGPCADKADDLLADGDEIQLGALSVRVLHTPGHTKGSLSLLVGKHLISGDILFPGGPGMTQRPEDLKEALHSITTRLYSLPDDTIVHPGHGDDITIAESKREYAVFASREHPPDLCGDVTWEGS